MQQFNNEDFPHEITAQKSFDHEPLQSGVRPTATCHWRSAYVRIQSDKDCCCCLPPTKITAITVTFNSLNSPSKRLICEISRETALYELILPLVQACWSSRNVGKAEKLVFKFGPIQYALHRVHHAAASLHSRVCTAGWWTGTERNGIYKRLHFMGQSASTGACRRAQWMVNMCEQVVLQFTDNISICLPTEMMMMLRGAAVFMEISWKK